MQQQENKLLSQGMNKDSPLGAIQDGQYVHALNAVQFNDSTTGGANAFSIQNESGFRNLVSSTTSDVPGWTPPLNELIIIGITSLGQDIIALGVRSDGLLATEQDLQSGNINNTSSEVGVFIYQPLTKDYIYKVILNDHRSAYWEDSNIDIEEYWNFNINSQIECCVRIDALNNKILYWTDGLNPSRWLKLGENYDINYTDNLNQLTFRNLSQQTRLFAVYSYPYIKYKETTRGGQIVPGVYQFAARYLNETLDPTTFGYVCNPIPVSPNYRWEGRTKYEGADFQHPPVDKSLRCTVHNVDQDYKYLEIAAIWYRDPSMAPVIKMIRRVPIDGKSMEFTFDGTFEEDLTLDELNRVRTPYVTSDHMLQKDGRLFLSNLKANPLTDLQKLANKLTLTYTIKEIPFTERNNDFSDYKNENNTFECKGYRRGEVYSFGIVGIFKDGSQSLVHHIPGALSINALNFQGLYTDATEEQDRLANTFGSYNYYLPVYDNNGNIINYTPSTNTLRSYVSKQKYSTIPDVALDYYDVPVYRQGPAIGVNQPANVSLAGRYIRHHRFPNVADEPYYRVDPFGNIVLRVLGMQVNGLKEALRDMPELQKELVDIIIVREQRNVLENRSIISQGVMNQLLLQQGRECEVESKIERFDIDYELGPGVLPSDKFDWFVDAAMVIFNSIYTIGLNRSSYAMVLEPLNIVPSYIIDPYYNRTNLTKRNSICFYGGNYNEWNGEPFSGTTQYAHVQYSANEGVLIDRTFFNYAWFSPESVFSRDFYVPNSSYIRPLFKCKGTINQVERTRLEENNTFLDGSYSTNLEEPFFGKARGAFYHLFCYFNQQPEYIPAINQLTPSFAYNYFGIEQFKKYRWNELVGGNGEILGLDTGVGGPLNFTDTIPKLNNYETEDGSFIQISKTFLNGTDRDGNGNKKHPIFIKELFLGIWQEDVMEYLHDNLGAGAVYNLNQDFPTFNNAENFHIISQDEDGCSQVDVELGVDYEINFAPYAPLWLLNYFKDTYDYSFKEEKENVDKDTTGTVKINVNQQNTIVGENLATETPPLTTTVVQENESLIGTDTETHNTNESGEPGTPGGSTGKGGGNWKQLNIDGKADETNKNFLRLIAVVLIEFLLIRGAITKKFKPKDSLLDFPWRKPNYSGHNNISHNNEACRVVCNIEHFNEEQYGSLSSDAYIPVDVLFSDYAILQARIEERLRGTPNAISVHPIHAAEITRDLLEIISYDATSQTTKVLRKDPVMIENSYEATNISKPLFNGDTFITRLFFKTSHNVAYKSFSLEQNDLNRYTMDTMYRGATINIPPFDSAQSRDTELPLDPENPADNPGSFGDFFSSVLNGQIPRIDAIPGGIFMGSNAVFNVPIDPLNPIATALGFALIPFNLVATGLGLKANEHGWVSPLGLVDLFRSVTPKGFTVFDPLYPIREGTQLRAGNYIWLESDINCEFRHRPIDYTESAGKSGTNDQFQNTSNPDAARLGVPYYPRDGLEWCFEVSPEYGQSRGYNFQYSKENNIRTYIGRPFGFLYTTDYPTRTIYSEEIDSIQVFGKPRKSELSDKYRIFLPFNYQELPKNKGEITNQFEQSGTMYLLTEQSIFKTFVNTKAGVAASSGEVFLGNAGVFQNPAIEVFPLEGGYAGCIDKWSGVNTPYGYFYVDRFHGKCFVMTQQLEEVSLPGMFSWFKRTLTHRAAGLDDIRNNPANPFSSGIVAYYDSKYRRILLTIRRDKATYVTDNSPNNFSLTPTNNVLVPSSRFATLSFGFDTKHWISFHDYDIHIGTSLNNVLFTTDNNFLRGGLFQHNVATYNTNTDDISYPSKHGVYYTSNFIFPSQDLTVPAQDIYPFDIYVVSNQNPTVTKTFDNLIVNADFIGNETDIGQIGDNSYMSRRYYYYNFFEFLQCWNRHQATGQVPIQIYSVATDVNGFLLDELNTNCKIINKQYQLKLPVSQIELNTPTTPAGLGVPDDVIINHYTDPINTFDPQNQSFAENRARFKDKYLVLRLRYSNTDNFQLSGNTSNFNLTVVVHNIIFKHRINYR